MTRIHVLVEGQTEETFVKQVLYPHFLPLSIFLSPIVIQTRRRKSGLKFRGGVNSYGRVRRDLGRLLRDRQARVTTMLDFYGLPEDFPGYSTLPTGTPYDNVEHLEKALVEDFGDSRLLPYLSLHEFEALLFVQPEALGVVFEGRGDAVRALAQETAQFSSPEEIDEGPTTHPAARISARIPEYDKVAHGPRIVQRIGLAPLRKKCPHFDRWISTLEKLQ